MIFFIFIYLFYIHLTPHSPNGMAVALGTKLSARRADRENPESQQTEPMKPAKRRGT